MKKIIADTSILLSQFEYGIDLPSELLRINNGPASIVIPSVVMGELHMLAGGRGKRAAAARFVLHNLEKMPPSLPVEEKESWGKADEWIIKYAQNNRVCVATNDVALRRRLLALGVPVIAVKGKSKLDFV